MRLGTRWSVGQSAPAALPPAVLEAIAEAEAGLDPAAAASLRWTLSWLENRPSVELDDGTTIDLLPDGTARTTRDD